MNTYFTSDLHFGHANIIKYCNRPFQSADGMDEALISNWNSVVQQDDTIYILGDVFFCNEQRAKQIMSRLNGRKHLILGNHDRMIRKAKPMQDMFDQIHPDLFETSMDGIHVVMCHYPMLTWNRAHRGSFMLHGHCHNTIPFDGKFRRLDVGVDAHGYTPISWAAVKRALEKVSAQDVRDY